MSVNAALRVAVLNHKVCLTSRDKATLDCTLENSEMHLNGKKQGIYGLFICWKLQQVLVVHSCRDHTPCRMEHIKYKTWSVDDFAASQILWFSTSMNKRIIRPQEVNAWQLMLTDWERHMLWSPQEAPNKNTTNKITQESFKIRKCKTGKQ